MSWRQAMCVFRIIEISRYSDSKLAGSMPRQKANRARKSMLTPLRPSSAWPMYFGLKFARVPSCTCVSPASFRAARRFFATLCRKRASCRPSLASSAVVGGISSGTLLAAAISWVWILTYRQTQYLARMSYCNIGIATSE